MEAFLICFVAFMSATNLLLLYFLGTYLVRMNDSLRRMFADLVDALGRETTIPQDEMAKSWDQKYEEELEAFAKRMRYDSGLLDIDGKSVYNSSNGSSRREADGLTPKEK